MISVKLSRKYKEKLSRGIEAKRLCKSRDEFIKYREALSCFDDIWNYEEDDEERKINKKISYKYNKTHKKNKWE